MSTQNSIFGEVFLDAIRQAVREEIQAAGNGRCQCLCGCDAALGPSATPYYGHVVCRPCDEGECDEDRAAAEELAQKVKSV